MYTREYPNSFFIIYSINWLLILQYIDGGYDCILQSMVFAAQILFREWLFAQRKKNFASHLPLVLGRVFVWSLNTKKNWNALTWLRIWSLNAIIFCSNDIFDFETKYYWYWEPIFCADTFKHTNANVDVDRKWMKCKATFEIRIVLSIKWDFRIPGNLECWQMILLIEIHRNHIRCQGRH